MPKHGVLVERCIEDRARQDILVIGGKADILLDCFTPDVYHELGVGVWVLLVWLIAKSFDRRYPTYGTVLIMTT